MNSWESTPRLTGIPGRAPEARYCCQRGDKVRLASDKGIDMQEMLARYLPIITRRDLRETCPTLNKTDEFYEKFQTAFVYNSKNLQYNFLD